MPAAHRWPLLSSTGLLIEPRLKLFQQAPSQDPEVLAAMQEIGIDLSAAKPQKLTRELANDATLLITMGCGDKCPYVPSLRRDDWSLPDPKGRPMDEVRAVRDDIKVRVAELIQAEGLKKEAV